MRTKDIEIGGHYGYSDSKRVWRYREVKVLEIDPERRVSKYGGTFWEKTAKTIKVMFMPESPRNNPIWARPQDIRMTWEEAKAVNQEWDRQREEQEQLRQTLTREGEETVAGLKGAFEALALHPIGYSNQVFKNDRIVLYLSPDDAATLTNVLKSYKNPIS